MAASIFDYPWILLIIGAVSLIQWLIKKAKGDPQDMETPPSPPPPPAQAIPRGGETNTEEERIRKFLEALGQPAGTRPPPKITPRPRQVIQPQVYPRLPRLKTAPPPPPLPPAPAVQRPAPPPLPTEYATDSAVAPADTDFDVRDFTRQTSSEPPPETRHAVAARIKLGTARDLRTAIVLREIFGPPRSLQPFDLTSGS